MDISDIYISLIVSYLKKEITEEEKNTLFHWVYSKPENEKLFYSLKDVWETAKYETTLNADTENEWSKFILKAIKKETENHKAKIVSIKNWKRALQYAAIIILALGIGFIANYIIPSKQDFATIKVPYGAKSQVELPDGSKVWVNSGSKLTYPNNMNERVVNLFLEGEAYFDIVKNKGRKLNVNTSTIAIQVLGTAFNIKSYSDEDIVETTLERGSISITGKVGTKSIKHPILLKPNQQATLIKSSRDILIENTSSKEENLVKDESIEETLKSSQPSLVVNNKISIEEITSWKDNILIFKSERFDELAVKLERWYDVNIIIEDEELKASVYTGTFEKETIEQAMDALSMSLPFKYEIVKNKIIVKRINTVITKK